MSNDRWLSLEPQKFAPPAEESNPLVQLARGEIPAVLFRQAFPAAECRALIRFLTDEGLMFDSDDPRIEENAITTAQLSKYVGGKQNAAQAGPRRIDIGASLGTWGDEPAKFFAKAAEAQQLFARLFRNRPDPVRLIYDHLQMLARGQRVVTAHEPDGRRYGPAIFRIHYGGFSYGPHFDSVRNREKRAGCAVHRFEHQFAGVLCVQNATRDGVSAQTILHRQLWNPEIDPLLTAGTFHDYAKEKHIPNVRVDLEAGDLYFFNTGLIHEVPGVAGDLPRVVLATFIGYSERAEEIMVWS